MALFWFKLFDYIHSRLK